MRQPAGRIRINAGSHRGRMIEVPLGAGSRPTGARVREALFNILIHIEPGVSGSTVLDACAGSGGLGIEALSRGAAHTTFFETDRDALATITESLRDLKLNDQATAKRADAQKPPANRDAPCDLVFLDPPYGKDRAPEAISGLDAAGWIAEGALIAVETGRTEDLELPEGFTLEDQRRYGRAKISLVTKD